MRKGVEDDGRRWREVSGRGEEKMSSGTEMNRRRGFVQNDAANGKGKDEPSNLPATVPH